MSCAVRAFTLSCVGWVCRSLIMLRVARAQPEPVPEGRLIDPASASDVAVSGPPGKGDTAIADMKRAGVGVSQMLREMVGAGYAAPDLAAGLRIYEVTTPDAAAAALQQAGFNPIRRAELQAGGVGQQANTAIMIPTIRVPKRPESFGTSAQVDLVQTAEHGSQHHGAVQRRDGRARQPRPGEPRARHGQECQQVAHAHRLCRHELLVI